MLSNQLPACSVCSYSRRTFLANCAKCIGATSIFSGLAIPELFTSCNFTPKNRMTVRVVFGLHAPIQPKPDWPNVGFDFNPVMEKIMGVLTSGCPEITFIQSIISLGIQADEIKAVDDANGNIDGYIFVQLNTGIEAVEQLVTGGQRKPVLFADFLYAGTGGFLQITAKLLRNKEENFAHISSGNFEHITAAAKCMPLAKGQGGNNSFVSAVTKLRKDIVAGIKTDMQCIDDKVDIFPIDDLLKVLKTKKILEFEKAWNNINSETKETLGIEIISRPFSELNDLWEKANKEQAMKIVNKWKHNATAIIDVADETLESSARMYLAMKTCLKNHNACGITIDCLAGFYGGHIQAYPCLGFHELSNEGLIGACECDTTSAVTMAVITALTKGRPGYISDPVVDMATKQIIYAHCVASNRVFGPQGTTNPFTIMTHSEDRQGASLRSSLPTGYLTTTLQLHPKRKEILFHQAKAIANSLEDRACRTKIACVPVGDFEKLYREWDQWTWHRVTYYGDLKAPIYTLADALGWKVVEEG